MNIAYYPPTVLDFLLDSICRGVTLSVYGHEGKPRIVCDGGDQGDDFLGGMVLHGDEAATMLQTAAAHDVARRESVARAKEFLALARAAGTTVTLIENTMDRRV